VLGRPVRYEEVAPPPVPEYAQLWAFLRAGGFARSTGAVLQLTGRPPVGFRAIVQENMASLVP